MKANWIKCESKRHSDISCFIPFAGYQCMFINQEPCCSAVDFVTKLIVLVW